MQNTPSNQNDQNHHTIDWISLVHAAIGYWKSAIAIVVLIYFGAVVAAISLPEHYRAKAVLLPPLESSINALNIDNYSISGEEVYLAFLDNLRSNQVQEEFSNIYVSGESAIHDFSPSIQVSYDHGRNGYTRFITARITGPDPEAIVDYLNGYIHYVDEHTVESLQEAMLTKFATEKATLLKKISSLRKTAEKQRQNAITRLIEDLKIADQLNISGSSALSYNQLRIRINKDNGEAKFSTYEQGYLKGTQVLRAELEALQRRKNNDPYIAGMLSLVEKQELLDELMRVNFEGIHAARFDQPAVPPKSSYRPNKLLIIAAGFFLGILLSAFYLLSRLIYARSKDRQNIFGVN